MENFDITKYQDIATRRKWWIIIPFLLALLAGLAYSLRVPRIYEAKTLILVRPQKVPQDFVRSIVTAETEDRLSTITQQVTSRTNLESIIEKYQLYRDTEITLGGKVESVRKGINIDVAKGGRGYRGVTAFSISFLGKDPKKVMQVTNALASNFISENLRIRESQAMGTSDFLANELESVKKRLMKKESELKQYRERHMGGLPEQLQTNLSILQRLQAQVEQLNNNLRDAENRKIIIQKEITEARRQVVSSIPSSPTAQNDEPRDPISLRNELTLLEAKYTQNHPDVVRLKRMIARLEAEKSTVPVDSSEDRTSVVSDVERTLRRQLEEIKLEINLHRAEIKKTLSQIKWYQAKVEETPKREQELLSVNRDYENLKELYNSLSNRKLEAEIAVSMETKQKGEQFRVIDPATIPERPVKPNVRKNILLTLLFGLGLGCGLAYLVETMDTSYKSPDEVETDLQLPVLVSLPSRYTEGELRRLKTKKALAFASVGVGFVLSAIGIVFATKGVDKTLSFVSKILEGM